MLLTFAFLLSAGMCIIVTSLYISEISINAEIKEKLKAEIQNRENNNQDYNVYRNKILMISKTLIVSYNLSRWEARYYAVILNDFSTYYKIPWEIYAATIKIESAFNPTLLSVKQAKGLMQILESTGKETANAIGIRYITGQSAWNEFINISVGCTYLSWLIRDNGLDEGVKMYLGGCGYAKNAERNKAVCDYIKSYSSDVMSEYNKLCYVYKGIVSEITLCNDTLYSKDNTRIDIELDPFYYEVKK